MVNNLRGVTIWVFFGGRGEGHGHVGFDTIGRGYVKVEMTLGLGQ